MLMKHCFRLLLAAAFLTVLSAADPARAACTGPAGDAGHIIFNADYSALQYCNGCTG